MTKQTFKKGMDAVEAGLQGAFQERFLDFLWNVVKDAPDDAWKDCAARIALGDRKPDQLTAGDFLRTLRDMSQEKASKDSTWSLRGPAVAAPDWSRLADRVSADPAASDGSKLIARSLESRHRGKRVRKAGTAREPEEGKHGA